MRTPLAAEGAHPVPLWLNHFCQLKQNKQAFKSSQRFEFEKRGYFGTQQKSPYEDQTQVAEARVKRFAPRQNIFLSKRGVNAGCAWARRGGCRGRCRVALTFSARFGRCKGGRCRGHEL